MVILASYGLGCFTSAYYLVRWRTAQDIRAVGSGNAGATNAGRVLGKSGFIITFLIDFAKGAVAVGLARYIGAPAWALALVMAAAVAGHIWPVQLRFRGGKGVATSLGALIVLDWFIVLALAGLFALAYLALRNFIVSGLIGFAICPLLLAAVGQPVPNVICSVVLAGLVIWAHRGDIRDEWRQWRSVARAARIDEPSSKRVKE